MGPKKTALSMAQAMRALLKFTNLTLDCNYLVEKGLPKSLPRGPTDKVEETSPTEPHVVYVCR